MSDDRAATSPDAGLATFGAGCFWCLEALLRRVEGVSEAISGYMGGAAEDASYEQVCAGGTGHVEVVQARFDPERVSYDELLELFWKAHDPTTLNRQGADVGEQYRSVIFYHDHAQKAAAERSRDRQEASGVHPAPIVTAIEPASAFHPAEPYHQRYYENNPSAAYCRFVIDPKLAKLGMG